MSAIVGSARESVTAPDTISLIAVSCLAYIASVALHEHLGHAAACVLLGSHPPELGAFYISCDDARLADLAMRGVALGLDRDRPDSDHRLRRATGADTTSLTETCVSVRRLSASRAAPTNRRGNPHIRTKAPSCNISAPNSR